MSQLLMLELILIFFNLREVSDVLITLRHQKEPDRTWFGIISGVDAHFHACRAADKAINRKLYGQ